MDFGGMTALVTGGSSGIGLATARLLSTRGAHVWLVARNEEKLAAALAQLESGRISPQQRFGYSVADVGDAEQAASAVAEAEQGVGLPDLVFNCAGVAHPGYFQELDLEVFRWMMQVNYFGTVYVTKAAVPGMIARGSGHIVNISSVAGFLGVFGYTAYGASKYAVRGFSEVLRAEMKPHGIRVSVVFPPDCDTPQLAYENQFKPIETKARGWRPAWSIASRASWAA
jgi:3-dehydrosphinganine reductase